jgi:D-alanine-D-alanine ligase
MSKKIRVGLLFGGRSLEHEVSLASAISVYGALDKSRYEVTLIAIDKQGRWLLPDPARLLAQAENPMSVRLSEDGGDAYGVIPYPAASQLVRLPETASGKSVLPHLDVMLPILHGTFGEDGTVQGLLELAQIPYVGSGVLGSALGMDKDVAGRLFALAGITTVPSLCVRRHEYDADPTEMSRRLLREFEPPFFIKPANAGSSVGVHKVKRAEDLAAALADAFSVDTKILAQKGIDARELEVAVLGNEQPRASIVGEIVPRHEFYSYEAKYLDEHGADLHIPAANLPEAVVRQAQEWAKLAFTTLECRGMARVDFFLDRGDGRLYINEINTIPGFTRISMYPKLWEASGLPYAGLLDELIRLAQENFKAKNSLLTSRK